MTAAAKPVAYSYERVSAPGRQVAGGGLERQADMAAAWCKRHGYRLDTSLDLSDKGKSAFKGKHLTHGALGRFLKLAEEGKLPESPVLLIEAVDRLSRQEPMAALQKVAFALVDAGVVIVDLEDQRIYDRDSLQGDALIMLVLKAKAAHEYSKRLARRVTTHWDQLRDGLREGSAVGRGPNGGRHPFWVDLNQDTRQWELNDRAADVALIFQELEHHGLSLVAQTLNLQGSRSPGGKPWAHYSVRKVATDPAAYGALRLGIFDHDNARAALSRWKKAKASALGQGKRFNETEPEIPPVELIPDHYPPVVSQEVFDRVQAALARRGKEKGSAGNRNGSAMAVHTFLQGGIASCQHGGTMGAHLSRKPGRDDIYYLRCRSRLGGKGCRCNGKGWRTEDIHAHVATRLSRHLLAEAVLPGNDHTAELQALQTRLVAAKQAAADASQQLGKANTALAGAVDADAQLDLLENLSALVEKRRTAARGADALVEQLTADISSLRARSHPADELRSDGVMELLRSLANGTDTQPERVRLHRVLVRAQLQVVLDDSDPDRLRVGMRLGGQAELDWQPLNATARKVAMRLGAAEPAVVWESPDGDQVVVCANLSPEIKSRLKEQGIELAPDS